MPDSKRKQIIDNILTRLTGIAGVGTVSRLIQTPWQIAEGGGTFPAYFVWGAEEEKDRRSTSGAGGHKSVTMRLGIRILTQEGAVGSGQIALDDAIRDAENIIEAAPYQLGITGILSLWVSTCGVATFNDEDGQGWGIGDMVVTISYSQAYGGQ